MKLRLRLPRKKAALFGFNNGSTSAARQLLDGAALRLDNITHTVIPVRGDVTPSMTRATTKRIVDSWGRQVICKAGEVAFPGARRVENLVTTGSENFNSWTATQCSVSPNTDANPVNGEITVDTVIPTAGAVTTAKITGSTNGASGLTILQSVYAKADGYNFLAFQAQNAGGVALIAYFNLATGAVATVGGSITGTYLEDCGGGVYRCAITHTSTASITAAMYVAEADNSLSFTADGTSGIQLFGYMCEDRTGCSDTTTPSSYVSVGVASAPSYHGSCVDGVQCFPTSIDGAMLTGMTTPLIELAATQLIATTADIRDMTTASWTLGATMTRARTSTGLDGAANSATRLTGGATAATNTITYTLTAAASSRTYSAYVKRITGTGPVRITQDNFSTSTDISSQLVNGSWVLVHLNQSQLNATMGFKIDTNGDAIDVDFNQFEAGTGPTSRIGTGGATRNADQLYYTSGSGLIANLKTIAAIDFKREAGFSSQSAIVSLTAATTNERANIYLNNATDVLSSGNAGGAGQWSATVGTYSPGTLASAGLSWTSGSELSSLNGVSGGSDGTVTVPAPDRMYIGSELGAIQLNGYPGKIFGWTSNKSQSELNGVTA